MEPNPATPIGRRESSLPDLRSLYEWVDTIPLSRPRRNLARDFSDAVLAAEVAGFLWPEAKLFGCGGGKSVPAFQPASSTQGKIFNWFTFRERVLRKIGVPATRADVEAAARGEPGAAEWVLAMLRQRAERGGSGGERRGAGSAAAAPAAAPTPPGRVVRKGGGVDVVSSHSYAAPSPLSLSSENNGNCRGGWRDAALAARIGGCGDETPATAAKRRTRMSRREPPPPTGPKKRVMFSPAEQQGAPPPSAAEQQQQQQQQQARPPPPLSCPALALARRQASPSFPSPPPDLLLLELERENAALRGQVARLERLSLRQEAQVDALLEALEDASATAAAAAAASAASAAPSPVAAAEAVESGGDEEPPPPPQQRRILSGGSLKLPGSLSFPSSSPLRALEGAVLIGRC